MTISDLKIKYKDGLITKPDYITQMYNHHKQLFEYSNFIRNTDIGKIEIQDDYIILTSRSSGIKLFCEHPDKRIAPFEILNFNFYEETDSNIIFQLIEENSIIFDIGTNIGWYTLNMAKLFKSSTIYAFEPLPPTFNTLKINIEINNLKNVILHNFGFSNKDQNIIFYIDLESSGGASSERMTGSSTKEILCRVKKLDDFIDENNVIKLDFIKCDVEGAELLVYQGGMRHIEKYQPIIFTEMLRKWSKKFNYHPNQIIDLLSALGYRCFTTKNKGLAEFYNMDENTVETNFFFLHSIKHAEKINKFLIKSHDIETSNEHI